MQEHLFFPTPSSPHLLCYPDFVGGYSEHPAHAVDRPARSDDLQLNSLYNLHLILGGTGTVHAANGAFELGAGCGFLYGPGLAQRYASGTADPWNIRWVHFACPSADRLLGGRGLGEPWLFRMPDLSAVMLCMDELLRLGRSADRDREAEASARLYELLLHLVNRASPLAMPNDPSIPGIRAAADHIRSRCTDTALSMSEVAALTGYSVPYFSRKFHQLMGRTPSAYLLESRVLHAKHLLMSSSLTVQEIAAASGFSRSSYFIHCFRKLERTTPERFRLRRRA